MDTDRHLMLDEILSQFPLNIELNHLAGEQVESSRLLACECLSICWDFTVLALHTDKSSLQLQTFP